MLGLMQDWPLLCHRVIDHAARSHGAREVVSRSVEGPIVRSSYAEVRTRALKLAQALDRDGVRLGDRIGTLAWNTARHLEAWYGIMGVGAIYHTLNPRLFPEQIAYIVSHAEDRMIFTDLTFVPLLEKLMPKFKSVEKVVVLTDRANMPETSLPNAVPYEDYIGDCDGDFEWARFDENTAAGMCYTSGTTGNPKGVVYSHRSNVLHSLIVNNGDMLGLRSADVVLPVVPFFHANGWSLAFSSPMAGSKLVLPGARMDGEGLYELLDAEKVTCSAAVPTIWLMLLQYLEQSGKKLPHLQRVVIGGSACPRILIEKFKKDYDVEVMHAWGMTEMSPLGTVCSMKPEYAGLQGEERFRVQEKQGHAPFGVEMKITGDEGDERPWDGRTFGRLKVRGPAVAKAYFKGEGGEILDEEGFFDTGDVATMDPVGYMQITDRAKDVIKSGGEWISSIDLENVAVGHPDVSEAAVIGVTHERWGERPLLVVVPKEGARLSREDVLSFLEDKVARFWLPNDVVFVDEIPHTATGKIQKMALREQFKDYRLPQDSAAE